MSPARLAKLRVPLQSSHHAPGTVASAAMRESGKSKQEAHQRSSQKSDGTTTAFGRGEIDAAGVSCRVLFLFDRTVGDALACTIV